MHTHIHVLGKIAIMDFLTKIRITKIAIINLYIMIEDTYGVDIVC